MRLDKFLKVSRILKRRTVAEQACEMGKVAVNGRAAKPGKQIEAGDVVEIDFSSGKLRFRVLDTKENAKKDEAEGMYEILEVQDG